jgi:transketolase
VDGHDPAAIDAAVAAARAQATRPDGRPTLICCKTVIGKGSPNKAGTHDVHGAPLGAAEMAATREALGWTAAPFEMPCRRRVGLGCSRRRRGRRGRLAAAL